MATIERIDMRNVAYSLIILFVMATLSGCLGNDEGENIVSENSEEYFGAYSVVAPVDTGINVYHDHFIMEKNYPNWLLNGLGVTKICDISTNGHRLVPWVKNYWYIT